MVSSGSAGWSVVVCAALAVLCGCGEGTAGPADEKRAQLGLEAAPLTYQAELVESPRHYNGRFSSTLAASGDTALFGRWAGEVVYVFERSGSVWTERQTLTGSGGSQTFFGAATAISGDTIVVGAYGDGANRSGWAHVFVRSGSSWVRQQTLVSSDGATDDRFGISVGISGDSIVVANAPRSGGRVHVFARTGSTWTEQQKITVPDMFGVLPQVAISGDTVVRVGAPEDNLVRFYRRNGTQWALEQAVTLNSPSRVAIEGNTALVTFADGVGVLVREGATWTLRQTIVPSDATDAVIGSVALFGETALFGARSKTSPFYSSVYVLTRDVATWRETQRIRSDVLNGCFGSTSGLSAGTAIVGDPCAEQDAVSGAYGAAHVFTTDPPSAGPIALRPSGPIDTNWPRYRFTRIEGATRYELELSGTSQVFTAAEAGCVTGTECSVRPSTTLRQGETTWRVRRSTLGFGGTSLWSNSLTVSVAQAAEAPASAPVGTAPASLITTTTPTYRWNAVPRATRYTLWVNDAAAASQDPPRTLRQLYQAAELGCEDGGECAVTPAKALAYGAAQWWVRAENPVGMSAWSAALDFTVGSLAPILIDPVGSVAPGSVTYRFTSVPNAAEYFLWVNDHTGPRLQEVYSAASANCPNGGTCSITPTTPPGVGPRTWWVRAQNLTGPGPWSASKSFTILGGSPPGTATLLAPKDGITTATPKYSWTAVTGATRYQLWVGNYSGRVLKQFFTPIEAGCGDGTCEATPTTPVPVGTATWWIQASNETGVGSWVGEWIVVTWPG